MLALFVAAIAHAVLFVAAIALHRNAGELDAGHGSHSVRIASVGPATRTGSEAGSSRAVDTSSRLDELQQSLATSHGEALSQAHSEGASNGANANPASLDALQSATAERVGASGAANSTDPYSRASFDPREAAAQLPGQNLIQSQAARCLGNTEDMVPVRLVIRLRPDGTLAGTPRALRSIGAAGLSRLRASEARAIQAVVQCAPYTTVPSDRPAHAFEIELGSAGY